MQLFGKSAKLAIGSVMVILSRPAGELTSASDIAEELGDSPSFVAKILQVLARRGILGSRKGATGGFYLQRPPAEITLWDLIVPFESKLADERCLIDGGHVCDGEERCGMHAYWARIKGEVLKTIQSTTVLDIRRSQLRKASDATQV